MCSKLVAISELKIHCNNFINTCMDDFRVLRFTKLCGIYFAAVEHISFVDRLPYVLCSLSISSPFFEAV